MGRSRIGEFTVECNPESATPELMRTLETGGVNRVSVGAQSFVPRHLATLERTHNPANVERAIDAARGAGIARTSVDLIFGIPGQTLEEWEGDVRTALALGTTHVSCYALTYEANTPMTARLKRGEFAATDEDVEATMFERTVEMMRGAGLARYEVSNFARPGHESMHNLAYWRQEQWLAAGPSASGHTWAGMSLRSGLGSWRWKNVGRLGDYLARPGRSPVVDVEAPDAGRLVRERIMMGLRIAEGIDGAAILADAEACTPGSHGKLELLARRFAEEGLLKTSGGRWTLTDAGFLVADFVAAELMAAV
jgi:oxygen-independent coproporphyrinogen-3 oxidase